MSSCFSSFSGFHACQQWTEHAPGEAWLPQFSIPPPCCFASALWMREAASLPIKCLDPPSVLWPTSLPILAANSLQTKRYNSFKTYCTEKTTSQTTLIACRNADRNFTHIESGDVNISFRQIATSKVASIET